MTYEKPVLTEEKSAESLGVTEANREAVAENASGRIRPESSQNDDSRGVSCDAPCERKAADIKTYFIHCPATNRVKIGRAKDPVRRFNGMKSGASSEIKLLGFIEGDHELRLHQLHREDRAYGEWFKLSAAVIKTVKESTGVFIRARGIEARKAGLLKNFESTQVRGEKNPASKLSNIQVAAIKGSRWFAGDEWYSAVQAFGVSEQTVLAIQRGKARADIDPQAYPPEELEAVAVAALEKLGPVYQTMEDAVAAGAFDEPTGSAVQS